MLKQIAKRLAPRIKILQLLQWLDNFYASNNLSYLDQLRERGEGATVSEGVHISNPQRAVLKKYSHIHRGTLINAMGGFYLGEYSAIGPNSIVFTVNHSIWRADRIPFGQHAELKPVVIRENVAIASGVRILPGVEIGEGAIVGMGAVVTTDVPPMAIVMGNPAAVIGYRDRKRYEEMKAEGRHSLRDAPYEEYVAPICIRKYGPLLETLGLPLPGPAVRKPRETGEDAGARAPEYAQVDE